MLALSGWSLFAKESEDKVSGVIKTVTGKNPTDIKQDARVSLNVPTIAESGANVPVKITVNIPKMISRTKGIPLANSSEERWESEFDAFPSWLKVSHQQIFRNNS